jgi:hypothetical protein
MANWLQKFMPPAATGERIRNALVPVKSGQLVKPGMAAAPENLPNASVIYGVAASVLIVVAVYFLFTGLWFTAFLVLLPAACFLGFALHFLGSK